MRAGLEWWQAGVLFVAVLAICYAFRGLASGGGDPNHKDHNRRHGPF